MPPAVSSMQLYLDLRVQLGVPAEVKKLKMEQLESGWEEDLGGATVEHVWCSVVGDTGE